MTIKIYSVILLLVGIVWISGCSYTVQEQEEYDEVRAFWNHNNGKAGKGLNLSL